jgi:hypothetical protein
LVNSRYPRFSATHLSTDWLATRTYHGHTFSRSYGIILPSSLRRVRSSALEFSSRLPVSVCGTVSSEVMFYEAFLGSQGLVSLRKLTLPPHHLSALISGLWPTPPQKSAYQLEPPSSRGMTYPSPSLLRTPSGRCRNINLLSIIYAFRPRLRDRLTLGRLALPRNP